MEGDDKKADQGAAGWQYKSDSGAGELPVAAGGPDQAQGSNEESVEWSASEFVAHEKNPSWYVVLGLATVLIAAGLYFITHEVFSSGVVLALATIMGIAGSRKPQVVTYRLDGSGITAGKRFHPYSEFKSFVMPEDGPFASIVLLPMKRLGFPTSAYLAPDSQQKVLDVLSSHLPLELGQLDSVDRLMRKLRF